MSTTDQVPTCDSGHPLAGDNLYLRRSQHRAIPGCRVCDNRPGRTVEQRAKDAETARARRARLKAEEPERWAAILLASKKQKDEAQASLSPSERLFRKSMNRARSEMAARERKALNVTVLEYHSLLEELRLPEVELARNQDRPSAAWNLLKVKGDAVPAWDEFSLYLETTATPCQGSKEWTEYDDPRPGREDEAIGVPMPGKNRAVEMCAPCPLLDLCQKFARKDKPDFGIWGGERYLGGKRV